MQVSSVPFSAIQGQSRLFLKYQSAPDSLRKFYPNAVSSVSELAGFAKEVTNRQVADREAVCDALIDINTRCGASTAVFNNIELLRAPNTVAVLTGQQTGLFSGPLYTIYKALSAIKLAEVLSAQGTPSVPIFWAATEDHDYEEVASTLVIGGDGDVASVRFDANARTADSQVGSIELDESINGSILELIRTLPRTEFTHEIEQELSRTWGPKSKFGEAFLAQMAEIFRPYGLIFVDPQNIKLKRLSAPIYSDAIRLANEIVPRIVERSNELIVDGYHAQVLVEPDYFPLFWQTDEGVRTAIRRTGEGTYRSKADKREFTTADLIELATNEPERFSPGVMVRPVVQDHLFPTICYFGGGAEIAYFAQNSVVYEALRRPVTPCLHRQSFTIIESRHQRTLNDLDLEFIDLFSGIESLLPKLIQKHISPDTAQLFNEVETQISIELDRLDQKLSALDVTLAANLTKRRSKMLYHIEALRKKAFRAELRKNESINSRVSAAFSSIYPNGHLQERSINVLTFLNKYGPNFVEWLYNAIDLDDRGHRLIHI